ncbi:hypothetical protein ERJ75_001235100 [Trypanosoma vivax]|nr:hypothetical protein TRVL_00029 [Trypanosoma vivax]KAH8608805.1 hypothetical protein ERJ75_001235100 [Trypanosoma vivax]
MRRLCALAVFLPLRTLHRRCSGGIIVPAEASAAEVVPADEPCSPFLASLLDPPVTVELVDAARTYATMDVVGPLVRYDPHQPNVQPSSSIAADVCGEGAGEIGGHGEDIGPVARAHKEKRLWTIFAGAEENKPPCWFYRLCEDLFYRRSCEDDMDEKAAQSDIETVRYTGNVSESCSSDMGNVASAGDDSDGGAVEVDPYLWLQFDLLDEAEYHVAPYRFPSTATYSQEQRALLCLGDPSREYVHFCYAYPFPDRIQIPTSVGTRRSKLYVDPKQATPVVYVQLCDDFPPSMWLPVKATAAAVRRVMAEFAAMAALHRDRHHDSFIERLDTSTRVLKLQGLPSGEGDLLRFMAYEARNTQFSLAPVREFPNQQEFFLGEHDDPERFVEHIDLCPFVFAIPHMRTVVDLHAEHMIPTVTGPGVATSLYRCIYSKTLLFVQVQLSAEVKLPPQDPEAFQFMWKDSEVMPKMKIPVFVRVVWPDNERMCGGGHVVRRFNRLFGTEFAHDIPVDAVLALFYIMQWAGEVPNFLGVRGMRKRLAELLVATQHPEPLKLYPGTREIPNPEYTVAERLGMHIQYLAHLRDPDISQTIRQLLPTVSAPVRMGCAKAALIAGDRELFRHIVSIEPPGRTQTYMTKLVRKRKARDLVDAEPRLLDDQYEFAAPLWTKRGVRIDRNTLEGALASRGRLVG